MEFEIYEEKEEVTKIRLMRNEYGLMCITAVDDDGEPLDGGCIAVISERGTLLVWKNLDPELGFQLDKQRRIIVET